MFVKHNCVLQTVAKDIVVAPSTTENTNYTVLGEDSEPKRRSKREAIVPSEEFLDPSGRSLSVVVMVGFKFISSQLPVSTNDNIARINSSSK